jgi:hypothetical protein
MKQSINPVCGNSNGLAHTPSGRPADHEKETPTTRGREAAPLGNTTVLGAPLVPRGSQSTHCNVTDINTGEIIAIEPDGKGGMKPVFDSHAFRHLKYQLHATTAEIIPHEFRFMKDSKEKSFRVAGCLRTVIALDKQVKVYKSKEHKKAHYGGLMVCGSIWTCTICASKITERKSNIIQSTIDAHKLAHPNGDVLLVTLTFPHSREDNLDDILKKFRSAERGFSNTKAVMNIKRDMGFIEPIKSLELTYGHQNGFHPHSHQLWFIRDKMDHAAAKEILFKHWRIYCIKRGLEAPSFEHGVDIRGGLNAGEYTAKMGWNLGKEVAKGHTKKAKQGRFAPFDLLQEYYTNETAWSKAKFIEYAKATFGLHYISRFPKLQKLYDITDKSDETLAREETDLADLVGLLTYKQWKKVCASEYRALVLEMAETKTWGNVLDIVDALPMPNKNKRKGRKKNLESAFQV